MIAKFFRSIKLLLNPPKVGDVYYGDPLNFTNGPFEKNLHGLKDKYGDTTWEIIPSDGCYRFIVDNASLPAYYRCESEVLCRDKRGDNVVRWMKRCQPRRINKGSFERMIIEGQLKKNVKP